MAGRGNGSAAECVVVDLNTQIDFLSQRGAHPVANATRLIPNIRSLVAWTKWRQVPVISSLDSHREGEWTYEGFPRHCVDGTRGQRKLGCTMMGSSIRIEGDNTLSVPTDLFATYQQVIFRQRTRDLFGNPKADRFLTHLATAQFLVYGIALETTVKTLTLGLLVRDRRVLVVADACGFWSESEADLALRQMEAKGARVVRLADLVQWRLPRQSRYPVRSPVGGNGSRNGTALRRVPWNGTIRPASHPGNHPPSA